jgi:hypothetical protein
MIFFSTDNIFYTPTHDKISSGVRREHLGGQAIDTKEVKLNKIFSGNQLHQMNKRNRHFEDHLIIKDVM